MTEENSQNSSNSNPNNEDFLPDNGQGQTILIKFGGNAMKNSDIQENVINNICQLKRNGYKIILVHGGGPAIKETLEMAGIESEFIGGHRKTTDESIAYVEMALKGKVNGELVRLINSKGEMAVGLSGKDGTMVQAVKRHHLEKKEGKEKKIDLGQVGDVEIINPDLIWILAGSGYIPVVAPIAYGEDFSDYNVNADMFAGHLASAMKADHFVVLTDVDGLMRDKEDPSTLIEEMSIDDVKAEIGGIIQGGMIPKIDACIAAIEGGGDRAYIINGTTKDILIKLFSNEKIKRTIITRTN